MVLWKYKDKEFLIRHNIFLESVFVTQPSSNVQISVWQTAWVDKLLLHKQVIFVNGVTDI